MTGATAACLGLTGPAVGGWRVLVKKESEATDTLAGKTLESHTTAHSTAYITLIYDTYHAHSLCGFMNPVWACSAGLPNQSRIMPQRHDSEEMMRSR